MRSKWRDDLSTQLGDHTGDMLAIAFAVAGLLCLLALFSDLVGPVGHGIDTAAAWLFGRGKALVPFAFLVGAACALAQRTARDGDDEGPARKGLRLGLGLTLVCATTVGLLFLDRRDGPWNRAGGAVGAAVGAPLRAGLGTTGRPEHRYLPRRG